jgi:hypothetical protein
MMIQNVLTTESVRAYMHEPVQKKERSLDTALFFFGFDKFLFYFLDSIFVSSFCPPPTSIEDDP